MVVSTPFQYAHQCQFFFTMTSISLVFHFYVSRGIPFVHPYQMLSTVKVTKSTRPLLTAKLPIK